MRHPLPQLLGLAFVALLSPVTRANDAILLDDTSFKPGKPLNGKAAGKPVLKIDDKSTALLRFDLSGLPEGTTAENIGSARLSLYVSNVKLPSSFDVLRITEEWGEAISGTAPALVVGTEPADVDVVGKGEFVSLDITDAVKLWADDSLTNLGLALVANTGSKIVVHSKESKSGKPPRLEIDVVASEPEPSTVVPRSSQQVALQKWYAASQVANTFDVGDQPIAMGFDGAHVWVANRSDANVTKMKASDGEVIGTYPVGSHPRGFAYDGANMWVVNRNSDTVSRLSARDGSDQGTFAVGDFPFGIAFDGENIWVANEFDNNVMKLSGETGALLGTYSVGVGPHGVVFDGANIWVANGGSSNVTKLLASDGSVQGTFPVGNGPRGICFDGESIWVTCFFTDRVYKLAGDGSQLGDFPTGDSPFGLVFDGESIWVANEESDDTTRLRISDGAVLGTYDVGEKPKGLNPVFDGANVWFPNQDADTVSKL